MIRMKMRWRRPYAGGLWRALTGFFVVVGIIAVALTSGIVIYALPSLLGGQDLGLVGVYAFAVWWLVFAWRIYGIGVYVSTDGIRIKNIFKTTTLPWSAVDTITVKPTAVLGFALPVNSQAIWIVTVNGPDIQTMLIDQSAEFLGRRRAFQQAQESLRRAHGASAAPSSA